MKYSQTAHDAGASGFFLDTDANAPADAFQVQEADFLSCINAAPGSTYTFAAPTTGEQYGTLTLTAAAPLTAAEQLANAKTSQIATIQSASQAALIAPMSFTNGAGTASSFRMTDRDVARYHLAYTNYVLGGASLPSGFGFYDINSVSVPFTVADIKAFFEAGVAAGDATLQKEATLIAQINAATTVSAVQAIIW